MRQAPLSRTKLRWAARIAGVAGVVVMSLPLWMPAAFGLPTPEWLSLFYVIGALQVLNAGLLAQLVELVSQPAARPGN